VIVRGLCGRVIIIVVRGLGSRVIHTGARGPGHAYMAPDCGGTVFTRSCGQFHPVHDTELGKEKGGKRCLSALGSGEGKKEMGGGGDVLVIPCTWVPAWHIHVPISWSCG